MNRLTDFVISALIVLFLAISVIELSDVIVRQSYDRAVTYQP